MARMIAEVYDALKSAGADEDKARAAATVIAGPDEFERRFDQIDDRFDRVDARLDQVDGRFDKMDGRLDQMEGRFDSRFERLEARVGKIETDVALLKWMVGANMALTIVVLGKLLLPG